MGKTDNRQFNRDRAGKEEVRYPMQSYNHVFLGRGKQRRGKSVETNRFLPSDRNELHVHQKKYILDKFLGDHHYQGKILAS